MVYKKLSFVIGERICKKCEALHIPYDIQNIEDIVMGSDIMELGVRETDWEKFPNS